MRPHPYSRQILNLPEPLAASVSNTLDEWRVFGKAKRLWSKDAKLWTDSGESAWLGWLNVVDDQIDALDELCELSRDVVRDRFTDALLLGMGGSSLCAEVLWRTFGAKKDHPQLHILDSTDPSHIRTVEEAVDLERTLFIVSSKSGTTLEPNILMSYFFERASSVLGSKAADRFIAITDPGSELAEHASRHDFRTVCHGVPDIGGRFSALSFFGTVPAAVIGLDLQRYLERARVMVHACGPDVPEDENPGVVLGVALGVLAARGRDKVTLLSSPGLEAIGAWLEQLLAESTGKHGLGLIPIDGENVSSAAPYGDDRLFVHLRLDSDADEVNTELLKKLERSGQHTVQISLPDLYDLGGEFFRWEIATAVAGSVLGINPFDQPDVEASKVSTRELTASYETAGSFPPDEPIAVADQIKLFTDRTNAELLWEAAGVDVTVADLIAVHLNRLDPGDYFALLAYLEMNETNHEELQNIRHAVGIARRVATTIGYGPRFLHSTGQLHKGGPNTGLFVQITCDEAADIPVPDKSYSFGVVKAAQARGDADVLSVRGRRLLRVHLVGKVDEGLSRLREIVIESLR